MSYISPITVGHSLQPQVLFAAEVLQAANTLTHGLTLKTPNSLLAAADLPSAAVQTESPRPSPRRTFRKRVF